MLRTQEQGPLIPDRGLHIFVSFGVTGGPSCSKGENRFSGWLTLLIAIKLNLQIEFVRKSGTN